MLSNLNFDEHRHQKNEISKSDFEILSTDSRIVKSCIFEMSELCKSRRFNYTQNTFNYERIEDAI